MTRKLLIALVLLVFLMLYAITLLPSISDEKLYSEEGFRKAAVKVVSKAGICSGFILKGKYVVTAGHCIPASNLPIFVESGWLQPTRVIRILVVNPVRDFAILEIKDTEIKLLTLNCGNSIKESELEMYYVLGYPKNVKKVTIKSLLKVLAANGDEPQIMLGAVDFGSSGSMVVRSDGTVVGLVSSISQNNGWVWTYVIPKNNICQYLR